MSIFLQLMISIFFISINLNLHFFRNKKRMKSCCYYGLVIMEVNCHTHQLTHTQSSLYENAYD